MLHTQTTAKTRLIAFGVAALMTFTIAVGVPALGHYETDRANIAINMEKTLVSNDVITVIGHRHLRGEAAHSLELADSTDAGVLQPCLK